MANITNVALGDLDSSTPLLGQEARQDSRITDLTPYPRGWDMQEMSDLVADLRAVGDIFNVLQVWGESDLAGQTYYFASEEDEALSSAFKRPSSLLGTLLCLDQMAAPDSHAGMMNPRPLSHGELNYIRSLDDVCNVLRIWGEDGLAARIAYFASDKDLEDGDIPVTFESAYGFLSFFSVVKSDGRVSLTCSPEGWICAVWRFPDERRASLWFLDTNRVMFAATNANGDFIEIDDGSEVGSSRDVMAKLVQAGLLTWDLDIPNSGSFHPSITPPGTVVSGILTKTVYPQRMRFYSERPKASITFPQTGWSTSTPQTADFKSTALSNL